MCGINGIFLKESSSRVEEADILRMRDCMTHRGPDEEGAFIDGRVGLGHRRLSIIGLTTGHQPMSNADGSLCIVYNGETYNYQSLRADLEKRGYQFKTESDTEVVLNLYAEYGQDCVRHMNGLFAFAVWDKKQQHIYVARDRLGIKPLYYAESHRGFAFASEIKAILLSGHCNAEVNDSAVFEYFMFRAVSGEQSLFKGVKSLLPGHHMTVAESGIDIRKYWDEGDGSDPGVGSIEEAVEQLDFLLNEAVKDRLMSEVPLGTFCSGGVDSSLVTALAAQAKSDRINTFSVGFDDAGFDESEYARMVSQRYNTHHHEIRLTGHEFAQSLPELIRLNDEPINFANSVHIYAVSKLAKEHVTVVLTGEGADELFLGYPRYHVPRISERLDAAKWLAAPALSVAARILGDHRLEKIRKNLALTRDERVLFNAATSDVAAVKGLLKDSVPRSLAYRQQVAEAAATSPDVMARLSIGDQKTYLVSILNRQDKMSMGASVEARVPFLDYRIAEFANHLASNFKTRGWRTKEIVKKVAESYLPDAVVHRRKSGFGVPLASYFRDPKGLGGVASRMINDSSYEPFLEKGTLQNMLQRHQAGEADFSELLWTATNFLVWKDQYNV